MQDVINTNRRVNQSMKHYHKVTPDTYKAMMFNTMSMV